MGMSSRLGSLPAMGSVNSLDPPPPPPPASAVEGANRVKSLRWILLPSGELGG